MAETKRIKRNIQKMLDQGASEQEIDRYVELEGVTAEQLRNAPKPDSGGGFFSTVGDYATSAAESVGDFAHSMVYPEVDPKYKDVPGVSDPTVATPYAKMTTPMQDKAYGDIIKKNLGDRLKSTKKDKFGRELITFTDNSGETVTRYVNDPGWDWQDVDRFVSGAVPYAVTASGAGKLFQGGGLLARSLAQAGTAFGTDAAMQSESQRLGSEQPYDPTQGALAALGGAGGEVAGSLINKFLRNLSGKDEWIDLDAGTLTAEGRRQAQREGLNGADISEVENLIQQQPERFRNVPELTATARQIEAEQLDIPITAGQRTGDPNKLGLEERVYKGTEGPQETQQFFQVFKDFQQPDAVGRASQKFGDDLVGQPGATPSPAPANEEAIASGVKQASKTLQNAERQAWKNVDEVPFSVQLTQSGSSGRGLAGHVDDEVGDFAYAINADQAPNASQAYDILEKAITGEPIKQRLSGGQITPTISGVRKQLSSLARNAQTPTDKAAAKRILAGYDAWVDDLVNDVALGPTNIGKALDNMTDAVRVSREVKGKIAAANKNDKPGRLIEKALDEADTPEAMVNTLIGSPTTKPNAAAPQALKRVKKMLEDAGDTETWDQIRLAYWARLVRGGGQNTTWNKMGLQSPNMIQKNINQALQKQPSVVKTLFDKSEIGKMRKFARVMRTLGVTRGDVIMNTSGSAHEAARHLGSVVGDQTRNFLRRIIDSLAAREKFGALSGQNVVSSRMRASALQALKDLPLVKGGLEGYSDATIRRAIFDQADRARDPFVDRAIRGKLGNRRGALAVEPGAGALAGASQRERETPR